MWSPRGDLIAFTKINRGTFSIGVMQPDGKAERILANGFLVEGLTWGTNGRVLMFFREERRQGSRASTARLYSIDLTGHNERQIATHEGPPTRLVSAGKIIMACDRITFRLKLTNALPYDFDGSCGFMMPQRSRATLTPKKNL